MAKVGVGSLGRVWPKKWPKSRERMKRREKAAERQLRGFEGRAGGKGGAGRGIWMKAGAGRRGAGGIAPGGGITTAAGGGEGQRARRRGLGKRGTRDWGGFAFICPSLSFGAGGCGGERPWAKGGDRYPAHWPLQARCVCDEGWKRCQQPPQSQPHFSHTRRSDCVGGEEAKGHNKHLLRDGEFNSPGVSRSPPRHTARTLRNRHGRDVANGGTSDVICRRNADYDHGGEIGEGGMGD